MKPHFCDFLGPPDLSEFIFQNWHPSFFWNYDSLTSCKKIEKTEEQILRSWVANGKTSGQMNYGQSQIHKTLPSGHVLNNYHLNLGFCFLKKILSTTIGSNNAKSSKSMIKPHTQAANWFCSVAIWLTTTH